MNPTHISPLKLIAVMIAATTFTAACSSTATRMSATPEPVAMIQPATDSSSMESVDQNAYEDSVDTSLDASDTTAMDTTLPGTLDSVATEEPEDVDAAAMTLQTPVADSNAARPARTTFHFGFNKAELDEENRKIVEEHGKFLARHPDQKVVINGHSDSQGDSKYNDALSLKRADYVADLLMQQGVSKDQIEVFSWGSTSPLADAHSNRDNRRVEMQYADDYLVQSAHASQ